MLVFIVCLNWIKPSFKSSSSSSSWNCFLTSLRPLPSHPHPPTPPLPLHQHCLLFFQLHLPHHQSLDFSPLLQDCLHSGGGTGGRGKVPPEKNHGGMAPFKMAKDRPPKAQTPSECRRLWWLHACACTLGSCKNSPSTDSSWSFTAQISCSTCNGLVFLQDFFLPSCTREWQVLFECHKFWSSLPQTV